MKNPKLYRDAAKLGLMLLVLMTFTYGNAQNYPLTNGYTLNPYMYNPAEAGSKTTLAFVDYRVQWAGMTGAPKYMVAGANTLLNNTRAGIGFKVSSFTRGFLSTSDAQLSYAYGIPVSKTTHVHVGLSGGVLLQNVDFSKISIEDASDPALVNLTKSIIPSLSFGVMVKNTNGFNFGVVIPQMIRSYTLSQDFDIVPQDNLLVMASYSTWAPPKSKVTSHNRSKKHVKSKKPKGSPFEAFFLYRYSNVGGQAEVSARYNFPSAMWLSASYRQNAGVIPGIGFNLGKLVLQYNYESGLASDFPLTSHEVFLMAKLGEPKKFRGEVDKTKPKTPAPIPKSGPRLNNSNLDDPKTTKVDSKKTNKNTTSVTKTRPKEEKKPPVVTPEVKKEPVVTQTEVKKEPVVEPKVEEKKEPVVTQTEVKKDPVVVPKVEEKKEPVVTQTEVKKEPVVVPKKVEEKKEPVVTQTEVKKDPVVEPKVEEKKEPVLTQPEVKKDPVVETKTEEKKNPPATDPTQLTEEQQHQEEQDKLARLEDHADNPTEEHGEDGHPHAERHEFVRRGEHQAEMDLGDYVIVGVFRAEPNAKRFADELKKLGFSEVDYGYLSNKSIWYVHIAGSDDIEEARAKRNKYRKMKLFKDAWLLTVHQ
jgi:type IX secretion system PorP/SprF family membrane protein